MSLETRQKSTMPVAFAVGIIVVALVVGIFVLLTRGTANKSGPATVQHLPFGTEQQDVAKEIHFEEIRLSTASNLLNQQFMYVNGIVENKSAKPVRDVEVTVEFRDPFNQVILRDTRRLFGVGADVLKPGESRDFSITLETLPAEWNRQYPTIRIVGLQLQ